MAEAEAAAAAAAVVGGVDVQKLGMVGAGTVGWLEKRSLFLSMKLDCLALAKNRTLVLAGLWSATGGGPSDPPPSLNSITLPASQPEDKVTALQWLVWQGWSVIAIGMNSSTLLIYSPKGSLLIKQNFNSGPILQLRSRSCLKIQSMQDVSEELTIVFRRSLVQIDALDLQSQLRRRLLESDNNQLQRVQPESEGEAEFGRLSYQIWNISKPSSNSTCVDAIITGVMSPTLFEQQTSQRYFCAVTLGSDSSMTAFRLSEDRRTSLSDILFSKVVPATVSTLSSLAKAFWRTEQTSPTRPVDVKPQEFGRASLITALKDPPRRGEGLAISPSGSLAAITDSLGRVLLLDVLALVIVRLWKGYRDAHCLFLEAPLDGTTGLPFSGKGSPRMQHCVKKNFCLCLAIHAPRRGIVEIWRLRNGPRVSVIHCEGGCRLLQPTSAFWTSKGSSVSDQKYEPSMVLLFDGDSGTLSLLNPFASVQ